MHGLFRVRGFTQDDAHIFCLPDQVHGGELSLPSPSSTSSQPCITLSLFAADPNLSALMTASSISQL